MLDTTGRCFSPLGGYPPGVYTLGGYTPGVCRRCWRVFYGQRCLPTSFFLRANPSLLSATWGEKNTRETVVRCLSAFCSNPSLLSAWCAASPLSVRTPHSSPRGAPPLRFLCEPLTPLRVVRELRHLEDASEVTQKAPRASRAPKIS